MGVLRAADILIDKIKKDYKDDVACVVIMGSHLYNATHSRSDLDLYYVPKTERGFKLARVFIIDGIGFDFWPISWERLERIANHDERITSIITEGKILYFGLQEDEARFNTLRAKALDEGDKGRFIEKAQKKLKEVYKSYFRLINAKGLADTRQAAMEMLFTLTTTIALLNAMPIKRGRGKLKAEILSMPLVPKDFAVLYDVVFVRSNVEEIRGAYHQLVLNVERLVAMEAKTNFKTAPMAEKLDGYYEEMIYFYNKIHHAAETGDSQTALFAAVELTQEIAAAFYGTGFSISQLPDIVGSFGTEEFLPAVQEHQLRLVEVLKTNGVTIREYRDYNELEEDMKSL